jgi:hypothetical protein
MDHQLQPEKDAKEIPSGLKCYITNHGAKAIDVTGPFVKCTKAAISFLSLDSTWNCHRLRRRLTKVGATRGRSVWGKTRVKMGE